MDFGALFLGLLFLGGICFLFGVVYPAFMACVWFFKYRKVQPFQEFWKNV